MLPIGFELGRQSGKPDSIDTPFAFGVQRELWLLFLVSQRVHRDQHVELKQWYIFLRVRSYAK